MRKTKNIIFHIKVYLGISVTIFLFLYIILFVFLNGFSSLSLEFIFGLHKPEGESLVPAIVNTLIVVFCTLLISIPIGVGTSIYLNEYSKKGSELVKVIRLTIQSLAAIPSVIFGLFGFIFFVTILGWSWSLMAGIFTLVIMVLPTLINATEESLQSVPNEYREGSYGLGAGKLVTIYKVILPSALPGIIIGVILSIGRIVGETAALILTAGTVMAIPSSLFGSGSTLAVYMYTVTSQGEDASKAYGVAIVLLVIVFILNMIANTVERVLNKN